MSHQVYTLPLPPLRRRLLRHLGAGWRAGFTRPSHRAWIGVLFDRFSQERDLAHDGLRALFTRPDISTVLLARHAWRPYSVDVLRSLASVSPPKSLFLMAPERYLLSHPPFVEVLDERAQEGLLSHEAALGAAFGGWVCTMPSVPTHLISTPDGRRQWVEAMVRLGSYVRVAHHPAIVMMTNPWLCRPSVVKALHEAGLTVGVHLHPRMSGILAQWKAWRYLCEVTQSAYPLYLYWHQSATFSQIPRPTDVVRHPVLREQIVLWIEEALKKGSQVTLWIDDDAEGLAPLSLEGIYETLERHR